MFSLFLHLSYSNYLIECLYLFKDYYCMLFFFLFIYIYVRYSKTIIYPLVSKLNLFEAAKGSI